MHRNPLPILLAAALLLPLATPIVAQDANLATLPLTELRTQLASGKQVVVSRQLGLTPAEESDFWPVYDELQRGLAAVAERRRASLATIAAGAGPGAVADAVERLVESDLEQAELSERAWDRLRRNLPPEKLARYVLLERRIATLERSEGR
jgi:hypothetical protein